VPVAPPDPEYNGDDMRFHHSTEKRFDREAEDKARLDAEWAQECEKYPFKAGDRLKLKAAAIVELKQWSVQLKRPDKRRIYRAETRATFIEPERSTWGHTMVLKIDGLKETVTFHHELWELA
jgi:hypothetical protein